MSDIHHNRLAVLAADIKAAHSNVARGALVVAAQALAAGRMLIEAKEAIPHGDWGSWLSKHVGMSARTARRYMQLSRSGIETATVAEIGIRGVATKLARSRISRPPLGHYAHAVYNGETQAIFYRCDTQPNRFHVVVIGRIDGEDHSINATRHPVPDELLGVCLAEAGFPVGAVPFSTRKIVGEVPELFRKMAFDDEEVASFLSPESCARAVALGISLSTAALIIKHGLTLEDGQQCLRLAALTKVMFEEAVSAIKSSGIPLTAETVIEYARAGGLPARDLA